MDGMDEYRLDGHGRVGVEWMGVDTCMEFMVVELGLGCLYKSLTFAMPFQSPRGAINRQCDALLYLSFPAL
jgi:hypothetical protein